jgi:cellulose synthase operon protein C
MIFHFPDLETLRIALVSGMTPLEVAQQPAEVSFDGSGRPSVKPHSMPPKSMQNALKRLGVKSAKTHVGEPLTVASWPEILPLVKGPGTPELAPTTPVLFEIPADRLAEFATEMIRLGNDRQSYRYVGDAAESRLLLRVIGPPYFTLLRALDHWHAGVVAYVERAPRVWVEIGHSHPLTASLKVPDGQLLLLRPPRTWTAIDDGPFHDIYEVLDFRLPQAAVEYAEGKLEGKLVVPLRLTAGNAADAPEMWALKDNAVEVFDAFVRDADERLTSRLIFAVAENSAAGPTIILRTRQLLRLAPPSLELAGAMGFTRYRKLNNLYVPAGTRLQPTLRRDAVRRMLADDDARIVWLTPLGDGRFVPESLPDEAFRPLHDWVDYVIDREREALQNWLQASSFDFESFICPGELPDDAASPGNPPKSRKAPEKETGPDDESAPLPPKPAPKRAPAPKDEEAYAAPAIEAKPDELKRQREELEKEFLEFDGPIEAPRRIALWPQLARVNGALDDGGEAAICWLNGLWERDDLPADWLAEWLRAEGPTAPLELTAAGLDRDLANETPTTGHLRRFAARLLYACSRNAVSPALQKRLPEVRRYLERHEGMLGVRAVWMAWRSLARVAGDVLGLARVRDRLIERLFKNGLRRQYDVPVFIHFAGQGDSGRLRRLQEHLLRFRAEVQAWLIRQQDKLSDDDLHKPLASTGLFADLLFSFGLAKLGEERTRTELTTTVLAKLRAAKSKSATRNQATQFLAQAFEFRIQQAAAGKESGPLPPDLLNQLDDLKPGELYTVSRMRQRLHVLEPHEKSDPYVQFKSTTLNNEFIRELANLQLIVDPKKLSSEIRRMLNAKKDGKERLAVLCEVVPYTVRVGREFAFEVLAHVLPALKLSSQSGKSGPSFAEISSQAILVDVAAPVAANYDATEFVQQILTQFVANMRLLDEGEVIASINYAFGRWPRALRRCGLKNQLASVLEDLTHVLFRNRSLDELRHEYRREAKRKYWVEMLCSLLNLSECWMQFGGPARALPYIEEARTYLTENQSRPATNPILYVRLECAYVRALAQTNDLDLMTERMTELLQRSDQIANTQGLDESGSWLHLAIVESIVLALVSDDFVLGETARRWLDDDEYLVRRRIHGDMKKLLAESGL